MCVVFSRTVKYVIKTAEPSENFCSNLDVETLLRWAMILLPCNVTKTCLFAFFFSINIHKKKIINKNMLPLHPSQSYLCSRWKVDYCFLVYNVNKWSLLWFSMWFLLDWFHEESLFPLPLLWQTKKKVIQICITVSW